MRNELKKLVLDKKAVNGSIYRWLQKRLAAV
jgi:hypothetical protein